MRIVLDTNVLVSALLSPNGAPASILQLVLAGRVVLCFDARILSEYREVLRRAKFDFGMNLVDEFLDFLESEGELVASVPLPLSLPDPDDAMFLEVAAAGSADYVVTGNVKHFPTRRRSGDSVVSARDFLTIVVDAAKTRIVHVSRGFELFGYKIKRGSRPLKLSASKIRSDARGRDLYAYPRERSIQHFKDQIRARTRRKGPVSKRELIAEINPVIRGWGNYTGRAHVRKLFARLARWMVRRPWSHRYKRWRNAGCRGLPERKLYGEYGLVNPISLIPSLHLPGSTSVNAVYGKTVRTV